MSKTKNTHKSNQYECLGKDAEFGSGLNILRSSRGSVAGVAETPIFAMAPATFQEVTSPRILQNKTLSTQNFLNILPLPNYRVLFKNTRK